MEHPFKIKLIVGLGNPGQEYEFTFHNAGHLFLHSLVQRVFLAHREKNFEYEKWDKFILVKPETFMNESGSAVREAIKKFGIKPEELLLVHDDSDLPLGSFKLSFDRGAAGHNGVISTIQNIGTEKFWRLRIGVRKETGKASEFVLKNMSKGDLKTLYSIFEGLKSKLTEKANP